MKRGIIIFTSIIFTLIVIAAIGTALLPRIVDINDYKQKATEQIKQATGYDVDFTGKVSVGLLPMPHASLNDVTVKNPQGFTAPYLAKFESLDVKLALAPLLSKTVDVKSLTLKSPDINLETNANGQSNWQMAQKDTPEKSDQQTASTKKSKTPDISLAGVTIENGQLSFKSGKSKPTFVSDINVIIDAKSLQGPFDLKGDLSSNGQTLSLDANVKEFVSMDDPLSIILKGDVSPASIAFEYSGIADAKAQELQGQSSVKTDMGTVKALITANPKSVALDELKSDILGYNATGKAIISLNPLSLNADINLDGTNLDITGSYKDALRIAAKADVVNIDKILTSLDKNTKTIKTSTKGNSSGDGNQSASNQQKDGMKIVFDVDIDKAIYNKQPIQNIKAVGSLQGKTLQMQSASVGNVAGTSVNAKGSITNISSMQGINGSVNGRVSNLSELSKFIKTDLSALPKDIKTLDYDVMAKGNLNGTLNIAANTKALGGTFGVNGAITNATTKPKMGDLNIKITNPNFAKLLNTLAPSAPKYQSFNAPISLTTQLTMKDNAISFNNIKGGVGTMNMAGNITIATGGNKPDIQGGLAFDKLVLQTSNKTQSGGAVKKSSQSAKSNGGAKWSSTPMDSTWLNAMNANLGIKADTFIYETWDIKNPSINFVLNNRTLNIKNLKAGLYGGTLQLSTVVKATNANGQGLNVNANTKFTNVDIEKLIGSFIGTKILSAKGDGNLTLDINGQGVSQKALISSLNGSGQFDGNGTIKIDGIDVAAFTRAMSLDNKPGDTVSGLWGSAGQGGSTVFNTLKGGFGINKGIVTLQGVSMDGQAASIASTGTADLPKWYLDTTHVITAKGEGEDLPTFTVNVKGPLDNPAQNIAQGALQDYFQKKLRRKLDKVLTKELDLGDGEGAIEQKLFNKFVGEKLNKELGINPQQQEPASGNEQDPANQNNGEQITPEKALEGVLKGLF